MTEQGLLKSYFNVLRNYVNFSGRASRSEFWWFTLMNMIVKLLIIASMFGVGKQLPGLGEIFAGIYIAYYLAVLLPSLAVGARRLHDTDRSGWWLLIGLVPLIGFIVLIVFFVQKGTEKENRFGKPVA